MDKFKTVFENTDEMGEMTTKRNVIDTLRIISRFIVPIGLIVFGLFHLFRQQ